MKVWWCEVHDDRPISFADIPECESRFQPVGPHWRDPCRMVEMQLVPADARMVELQCPSCKFVYELERMP